MPPSAKARASGMPTYPAPTMATSGFIAGQGYRRQATCRSPARPGPGHDGFRPIALTEGAAYRDGLGSILAGATLRVRLGPLAQLVEQGTLNPKVAGSIPARPTFSDVAQPVGVTTR